MKSRLTLSQKAEETLKAIEGLSENELRILQLLKAERSNQDFLNLNATAHSLFGIDNALDIVSALKDKGFIFLLPTRR